MEAANNHRRAITVDDYLAALPADRRGDVATLRAWMRAAIPDEYQETMQYGMIGYSVPHALCPAGYHCDPKQPLPFAGLGLQKHHIGLYLFCAYVSEAHRERFERDWQAAGHKLDMGKGCVRVRSAADVPRAVLATALTVPVDAFIASYEASLSPAILQKRAKLQAKLAATTTDGVGASG